SHRCCRYTDSLPAELYPLSLHDALPISVILLDVNMPGIDGFETAALIRQRKKSAHTPIIFITAFADELRIAEGYAQGAVDYILRSEEHTSELQSRVDLVCRLLLEKKKQK